MLSKINPDEIENSLISKSQRELIRRYSTTNIEKPSLMARFNIVQTKAHLPAKGLDPKLAYEMIHDDLTLDGSPILNLASFVNVHTEPDSQRLIEENLTKNLADNDEYPMLIELQNRCIAILGDLWHSEEAIGTPTTGSSEAVMLGGLAMKKNWQAARRALKRDISSPNILMASCCQVALEKFARYFDVECRIVPVSDNNYLINYDEIKPLLDENTIGIFVIVGSTYTGGFEDVAKISQILDEYEAESGYSIPIHVDGASGGFVAPFVYPDLKWDFQIERVKSINTSGHKFGLVTAGLGWILFRDKEWLPDELKFQLDYLGGVEESFSLNFSRPGYPVVHQYYNFMRLGRKGYTEVFNNCLTNARILSCFLEETGWFKCISNLHLPVGMMTNNRGSWELSQNEGQLANHEKFNPALPVVSFQFNEAFMEKYAEIPQVLVSKILRNKGWIVPNYHLPKTFIPKDGEQAPAVVGNDEILRVVVKFDLSSQLLDKLMHDIVDIVENLVGSIDMVKEHLKHQGKASNSTLIYNMLLSISQGGDSRLIQFKDQKTADDQHGFKAVC
ncbi:glutamate decarboxylase [Martiniozyma asiatica (nom. inval.)]|nr:glutamate decarboxylase [Martiniozyma asiatica]